MSTRKKQAQKEASLFQYLAMIFYAVVLVSGFLRIVQIAVENYCAEGYSFPACNEDTKVEWDYSQTHSTPAISITPDPSAYEVPKIEKSSSCYEVPVENHEYNAVACLFVLGNKHYSACHLVSYKTVCR